MPRLHLFEFGDQAWFPDVLRDAETAYLTAAYRALPRIVRQWTEKICSVLATTGRAEIVDLCSGSGGAMPAIVDDLCARGFNARATLTDLYPKPDTAAHPRIAWVSERVDATRLPRNLDGVRTIFSAFHHFRPGDAKAILKDALDSRCPICVFESGPGRTLGMLNVLGVPFAVLLLMPLARPWRWQYMFFTYVLPLLPFIILWDGLVSNLRVYSPEELKALTADLQAPGYAWEIGRIPMPGIGGLPYLIGRPV